MDRKVPMQAASRSSIQPMNARALPTRVGPAMATGNSRAVMATRNKRDPVDTDLPGDAEVAEPRVLADELEPGLAGLEVDDQVGDEGQFDDRRRPDRWAWPGDPPRRSG